jgi:RNA polymerase sigma factor (sigma-70 family)
MKLQSERDTGTGKASAKPFWYVPDARLRTKAAVRDTLALLEWIRTGTGLDHKPGDQELFAALHTCAYLATKPAKDGDNEQSTWARRWSTIREFVVQQNLGLAYSMMSRFNTRLIDEDDLLSDAMLGLTRAVDRFNPWRGYRFSTYACNVIVRALMRRGKRERNRRRLFPVQYDVSFEKPMTVADPGQELFIERLSQMLESNVGQLTDLESRILSKRFTSERQDRLTFQEIGDAVGLSKERVRQIQNIAIRKLRRALAADPVLQ